MSEEEIQSGAGESTAPEAPIEQDAPPRVNASSGPEGEVATPAE